MVLSCTPVDAVAAICPSSTYPSAIAIRQLAGVQRRDVAGLEQVDGDGPELAGVLLDAAAAVPAYDASALPRSPASTSSPRPLRSPLRRARARGARRSRSRARPGRPWTATAPSSRGASTWSSSERAQGIAEAAEPRDPEPLAAPAAVSAADAEVLHLQRRCSPDKGSEDAHRARSHALGAPRPSPQVRSQEGTDRVHGAQRAHRVHHNARASARSGRSDPRFITIRRQNFSLKLKSPQEKGGWHRRRQRDPACSARYDASAAELS